MSDSAKISVIMPSFNSESTIGKSIESVLAQSYTDLELIVVDDSSSDQTSNIVRDVVLRDSRVQFLQLEQNRGAAVSRNAAIKEAKGRYIAFLDADDIWNRDKLQKQIKFMKDQDCAFCHSWYEKIDADGQRLGIEVKAPHKMSYKDMLKSNRVGCLTAIYDTVALGKVYMPLMRKRQDYGLWLSLLKLTPYVHCFPEVLAQYRVVRGSISSNKLEMLKYNWKLYREVEKFSPAKSVYYLGWNILRKLVK